MKVLFLDFDGVLNDAPYILASDSGRSGHLDPAGARAGEGEAVTIAHYFSDIDHTANVEVMGDDWRACFWIGARPWGVGALLIRKNPVRAWSVGWP